LLVGITTSLFQQHIHQSGSDPDEFPNTLQRIIVLPLVTQYIRRNIQLNVAAFHEVNAIRNKPCVLLLAVLNENNATRGSFDPRAISDVSATQCLRGFQRCAMQQSL
jgi:hypothetical protein